jgi:hypothetical protein
MTIQNRWLLAAAGVLMQIAFGAVYAWSVFRIPLSQAHGWTIAEVTAAFEIADSAPCRHSPPTTSARGRSDRSTA